jgi:hypothetical protein
MVNTHTVSPILGVVPWDIQRKQGQETIQQEWARFNQTEIQKRLWETLERCELLVKLGSERIKSAIW